MTDFDPRIGQRFLVGFHGLQAPTYLLDWLAEGHIAGVVLFGRNVESPQQVAALTHSLHAASPTPILIGIDQEGGIVARLRQEQGFTESPGAMALSAAPDAAHETRRMSKLLADEMYALGINWTFAPVLDLSYNAQNPTVGTRSIGRDVDRVAQLGMQAIKGFQMGAVMACAKHFPGLGNTGIDSHLDLPILDTPLDRLIECDLVPYQYAVAADVASIMATHTIYTTIDPDYPATLSPTIIQTLLRDKLAYNGLVITDCMEMHAIAKHYGIAEATVLAVLAGIDLILISHSREKQELAFAAVQQAYTNGRIPSYNLDEAHRRIQQAQVQYMVDPHSIDPQHVGTDDHRQQALKAAQAGVSLDGTLPELTQSTTAVIEFTAHVQSDVMEEYRGSLLAQSLDRHFPSMPRLIVHPITPTLTQIEAAHQLAKTVDTLIVVTRNAHRQPAQATLASDLLAAASQTVLVALRNPYDADLLHADATLCTFGDSTPSIEAAVLALKGCYQPQGKRPLSAEV